MRTQQFFSAINASLMILNRQVGYIQNVELSQDNKLRPISSVMHSYPINHIVGVGSYRFTATKAFVDLESMLMDKSVLGKIMNAVNNVSNLAATLVSSGLSVVRGSISDLSSGVLPFHSQNPQQRSSSSDLTSFNMSAMLKSLTDSQPALGSIMSSIPFDISVKGVSSKPQGLIESAISALPITAQVPGLGTISPNTLFQKEIEVWKMISCKINSRKIRISTANIIIFEDIEGLGINMVDSYMSPDGDNNSQ